MTHTLLPVVLQIVKVSVLIIVTEQMVPLLGNSVTNQTFHLRLTVKENKMNIIFSLSLPLFLPLPFFVPLIFLITNSQFTHSAINSSCYNQNDGSL